MLSPLSDVVANITLAHRDAVGRGHPLHQFCVETNIRMGTALFAKVFRIVSKWYGNPTAKEVLPQVMDDAVIAWQTGYFEGVAVFRAEDPGQEKIARPATADPEESENGNDPNKDNSAAAAAADTVASDPYKAGIRIDLSGIGTRP